MLYSFLLLMSIFIWMGFVGAISFMESWLKFKAPGVTLPLGLNIGKLIFRALNRVEWFLAIVTGILLISVHTFKSPSVQVYFGVAVVILIAQTFWLLPSLNKRAMARINGETVAKSYLHYYFVAAEFFKICVLFLLAFSVFSLLG